jgi:hypothetical protein
MGISVGLMNQKYKEVAVYMERKTDRMRVAACLLNSEFESIEGR